MHNYEPAWWLYNGHLQTIWPRFARRRITSLKAKRERLELPDGDFLDLDWVGANTGPIIVVLHGLAGNIQSHYAQGLLNIISNSPWRGLLMHFRGCSGTPNRLPRFYHSGETGDLQFVIDELRRREPDVPLAVVGYSMGGNVLIKWLSQHSSPNVSAAVAISVPFELYKAADRMNQGFSRFYQWYLLRELRQLIQAKLNNSLKKFSLSELKMLRNFWDFDNKLTAPLHGFKDAHDYYHKCSTREDLKNIETPTLILHARDDPFMPEDVLPNAQELSPQVTLEVHEVGGHVGFVMGKYPWRPVYWLEHRIIDFLKNYL